MARAVEGRRTVASLSVGDFVEVYAPIGVKTPEARMVLRITTVRREIEELRARIAKPRIDLVAIQVLADALYDALADEREYPRARYLIVAGPGGVGEAPVVVPAKFKVRVVNALGREVK